MKLFQSYKWHADAACLNYSSEIFFDEAAHPHSNPTARTHNRRVVAKRICRACPVMDECRETFINEPYGVFGGLDQEERAKVRRKRARAKRESAYAEDFAGDSVGIEAA